MDHPLKARWHSYLINVADNGSTATILNDGQDHVMDLSNMEDDGDLDSGTHNGRRIKGKATQISNSTYFLSLDYEDGSRRYEGFLVRDKVFGVGRKLKIVAGRYVFQRQAPELTRDSVLVTSQEEGTWIITHP